MTSSTTDTLNLELGSAMTDQLNSRRRALMAVEERNPWMTKVSNLLSYIKTDDELAALKNAKLRKFYEQQNNLIQFMEHTVTVGTPVKKSQQEEEEHSGLARLAINLSFALNVSLVILYVVVLFITGSVAMFASVLDSCMDVLSGLVLFFTQRSIDKTDIYRYPQGKRRLEPLGVIVFASIMSVAALQIVREACQRLVDGAEDKQVHVEVNTAVEAIVVISVTSKLAMGAFCYVVGRRTGSTGVKCYATDHFNDTCLNSVGLGGMMLAAKVPQAWFADPIAAIAISALILFTWYTTGKAHIDQIVGRIADHDLLKKITFMALNHDENILFVDTNRAYHFGERVLVEVDVVLPEDMPLVRAHDIGESLQIKIEELDEVERAFCHLDYEFLHKPEHPPAK